MKPYFVIISLFVLLVGCSSNQASSEPKKESTSTITEQSASPTATDKSKSTTNKPEDALNGFYKALIAKDYNKAKSFLSQNRLDKQTPDEFINNYYKKSIELKEFLLTEITDIDETHKFTKVLAKGQVKGKENSIEDPVMLTLENGKWLLDFSLALSKETVPNYETPDSYLSFTDLSVFKLANGYQLTGKIRNNLTKLQVLFGETRPFEVTLKTDKGSNKLTANRIRIAPQQEITCDYIFVGATGTVQATEFTNILLGDQNGRIQLDKPPLMYTVPLQ